MKRVCVLGLRYIGFSAACLFARHGYQVTGIDTKAGVVDKVHRGEIPFEEPGIGELFQEALDNW